MVAAGRHRRTTKRCGSPTRRRGESPLIPLLLSQRDQLFAKMFELLVADAAELFERSWHQVAMPSMVESCDGRFSAR
jgi:hypothetical protein